MASRHTLFPLLALAGACLLHGAPAPPDLREAAVRRITEAGLRSDAAYRNLGSLCDQVGHRLAGSPGYDKAVTWALALMKAEGFTNVRAEPVPVPRWVRNTERADMILPRPQALSMLGLGLSDPTPEGGLTADVVAVGSFDELKALPDAAVRGRIVLFDAPWTSYGATGAYRWGGAVAAARRGAVGVLIRSVAPSGLDTPHTGSMAYAEGVPRIPAAALSLEDASLLHRLYARGERVQVRLKMNCRTLPDAPSANIVGELPGTGPEIVLLGAHLDSWDVGQGAQDDGVGCMIVLEAVHLLHDLGLRPRRTLRVVLFTNEENGNRGGRSYAETHRAELPRHAAAVESDEGNGLIQGFSLELPGPEDPARLARAQAFLARLKLSLAPLGVTRMTGRGSGVDIGPTVHGGVPGLGSDHDGAHYFDIHHSRADTFDKVRPEDLAKNVTIMAIAAYLLADDPDRLADFLPPAEGETTP